MVDNLLETGTLFDYKNVDFTKLCERYEQFEADLADDACFEDSGSTDDIALGAGFDEANVEDDGAEGLKSGTQDAGVVAPMVGGRDIPVRDERYIDQRQERFDTAEPDWHVPTFEDEE